MRSSIEGTTATSAVWKACGGPRLSCLNQPRTSGAQANRTHARYKYRGWSEFDRAKAKLLPLFGVRFEEKVALDWGIYHYCGRDIITWFGFPNAVLDLAGRHGQRRPQLVPISIAAYRQPCTGLLTRSWLRTRSKKLLALRQDDYAKVSAIA
jgi:hypothetical protein